MNRSSRHYCSTLLILATLLVGVVPADGRCLESRNGTQADCCCCTQPAKGSHACCQNPASTVICSCSVGQERPAVPREQRSVNEQVDVRVLQWVTTVMPTGDERCRPDFAIASTISLSSSTLRHLAVLCRWQT